MELEDFESHLSLISSDHALLNSFRARHPALIRLFRQIGAEPEYDGPKPFPPISEMTAIQAAIFDNWPGGARAKGHPNRYGMAIEVWTAPADQINVAKKGSHQFKGNVRLMDADELKARIAGLCTSKLRNPITAEYAEALRSVQGGMLPGDYVGLISTKTRQDGTHYHDRQFVFVSLGRECPVAVMSVGGECLRLPSFSSSQPNGKPLGTNVILQSRFDGCGFSSSWATDEIE